jgi:hypothetical protein
MSRLSVYWPDECVPTSTAVAEGPRIIPFPGTLARSRRFTREAAPKLDVISRARLLFANRQCRHCSYPMVEPLELDDAQVNLQGLEIPGTSTIIGFRCHSCDAEWYT